MESSSSSAKNLEQLTDAKSDALKTLDTVEEETSSSSSSSSSASDGDASCEQFEGVSAAQFDDYSAKVLGHLDALTASAIVLVFAVFFCAGILAVGTLVRSFERGSR